METETVSVMLYNGMVTNQRTAQKDLRTVYHNTLSPDNGDASIRTKSDDAKLLDIITIGYSNEKK